MEKNIKTDKNNDIREKIILKSLVYVAPLQPIAIYLAKYLKAYDKDFSKHAKRSIYSYMIILFSMLMAFILHRVNIVPFLRGVILLPLFILSLFLLIFILFNAMYVFKDMPD